MRAALVLTSMLVCAGCKDAPSSRPEVETTPPIEDEAVEVPTTPLRRLSPSQYQRTVEDLFPLAVIPEQTLLPDPLVHGFDNNAHGQTPSTLLIEQYETAAFSVAAAALATPALVLPCPDDGGTDPLGCGATYLTDLTRRAFRRTPTQAELDDVIGFFEQMHAEEGDFRVAIQLGIAFVLQSPEFLYLVEHGDPGDEDGPGGSVDDAGPVPLTGEELAARLSYFLWNTTPDDALLAAAAAGSLAHPGGVEAEAWRMLADPRAEDAVANFTRLWLSLDALETVTPDLATYPTWHDGIADAMHEQVRRDVSRVFFGERTWSALLRDPTSEVDADLAAIYGVSAPVEGWHEVALPAGERSGILTRAGWLALNAHEVHPSPVQRGLHVLERMLCFVPGPPPPDADTSIPEDAATEPTTNRERYAAHTSDPTCAGCHAAIDGIGFGFEGYDSVGAYRTTDAGQPVDATGELLLGDLAGIGFDGALELSELLATSELAHDCHTLQWYRYAHGRTEQPADAAALAALQDTFRADGGQLQQLLVDIVTSETFRTRSAP